MIYLDNSATTFPKPSSVRRAVNLANLNYSFNSGRGGYRKSSQTASKIFSVREKAGAFFGCQPQNIVFTHNCTHALNIAVNGLVKQGDRILISSLEHNAVARPVNALALKGVADFDIFDYSPDPNRVIENINSRLKPSVRLIVCTCASNVFGCTLPVNEIAALAAEKGIYFILDAAQGAGIFNINCEKQGITACCIAGHKGLYAPMSTGILALNGSASPSPLIFGGTGSSSALLTQPGELPEGLEAGTLNNGGIIGLGAGIDFVSHLGVDKIYLHELELVKYIYDELCKMPDIVLYTSRPEKSLFAPIISFNYKDYPSEKTAALLAEKNICVRAGLHCAPLAHKAFNTLNRGTVRISPCVFTSFKECEIFINSLKKL